MYEPSQKELTETFVWMCQSEVARTLAARHASPVWTDRDGCLTPVALMSARRLSALRAYLERRLSELPAPQVCDTALMRQFISDYEDCDWYPGDQAVYDDWDRNNDDDDPDRRWLEYWLLVIDAWSETEEVAV